MTALAVIGEAAHVRVEAHVAVNVGRLIIPLVRGLDDLARLAIHEVGSLAQQVSQFAGLAVGFPSELIAFDLGDHAILNVDVELHNSFAFSFCEVCFPLSDYSIALAIGFVKCFFKKNLGD